MKWKKLGRIFVAEGQRDWMCSHTTVPVPLHVRDDIFRIYFCSRNDKNQSQVGYIEIDITKPFNIIKISDKPVIGLGKLGYFDCDGVYATSIVSAGSNLYFYYGGWNAGLRGLFYSSIGLAVSEDGGLSFERVSEAPILSRDETDKWLTLAPFVMKYKDCWKMWYISGIELFYVNDVLKSRYDVKYAYSGDGIRWEKTGTTSVKLGNKDNNIGRCCVLKENDVYKCWYPYVSKALGEYRIGYGESKNGVVFNRKDSLAGIDVSQEGWDSLAITYPYIFKHKGMLYMIYNGNQYGKTGFGLAVLEEN